MMVISEDAKWFAIGQVLSIWPDDKNADEVLSEVELMTDEVTAWQPFEDYDGDWLVEHIIDLAKDAQLLINHVVEQCMEAGDLE